MNKAFLYIQSLCKMVVCISFFSILHAESEAFPIRVLLEQVPVVDSKNAEPYWAISTTRGFRIQDVIDPSMYEECGESSLELSFIQGRLALNGRRLASNYIMIIPHSGITKYGVHEYAGVFLLRYHDNALYLMNQIDLEEYVFSVVRWEGWPGWPLEVYRVIALKCRAYVVNQLVMARKKGKVFDIKKTNVNQTYHGIHTVSHLRQAVEDTRGMVITYKGKPIDAMYDACCGGVVPAKMDGIKEPYLKRSRPCHYCKKTKVYSWEIVYSLSAFHDLIASEIGHAGTIIGIMITKKDKAGIVQEIRVSTKAKRHFISGKRLYSLLKDLKSFCFDVEKKGKKIIFKGRGYGHHLGVCQWGASQMVKEGFNHKQVLEFYYPGISFMNIKVVEGAT